MALIMTQEQKDLLIKDLCARLPYGTIVYAQNDVDWYDSDICTQVLSDVINEDYIVKPYLFPLSSMTEEQKEEYRELCDTNGWGFDAQDAYKLCDWLNKHHLDWRGLIPMGLAIDATDKNIY